MFACSLLPCTPRTSAQHLSDLSKSNSSKLVAAVLNVRKIPRDLGEALFSKCRGSPRFIVELAELLVSEGKVVIEGGTCRVDKGDFNNLSLPQNYKVSERHSHGRVHEEWRDGRGMPLLAFICFAVSSCSVLL